MGITYSHNNSTITIIWQKTQLLQLKLLSIVQRNWNVERGKKNSIYKKEAHKSELQKTKQKKRCQGHLLKNKKNKIFHNIHLKKKKTWGSFIFLLILYFESLTSVLRLLIKISLEQNKNKERKQLTCNNFLVLALASISQNFEANGHPGRIHFHYESRVKYVALESHSHW